MAKEAKGQPEPQPVPELLQRPVPNENPGPAGERPLTIDDLVIPAFQSLPSAVDTRSQLVTENSSRINLENAEYLMRHVQAAQRNLTETLNRLSSYRKVVSQLLESRRREAAAVRKQQAKEVGTSSPTPLADTSIEILADLDQ